MTAPGGTDRGSTLRRAAERPRRTGVRAVLFLGVAVVAAVATAFLFTRYLEKRAAAARVPTAKVVVAAVDVAAATALRAEALTTIDWPATSVPAGTSGDPAALVGRVVTAAISKGEPILSSRLAAPGAGAGLAAVLPGGMRAVAVRVDDVVGVAGFLHPGDTVDVIVTMRPTESGTSPPVSKIVLQNVRVLAVGKEVERADRALDKAIPATVATLMVNSEDSERLALAATKGQILLSLRSASDGEAIATGGITPPVLLAGTARVSEPAPAPARPAPAPASRRHVRSAVAQKEQKPQAAEVKPAAAAPSQTVEILRGDLFERRDFDKGTHP